MNVRACFVDAAGTLLKPREPVGITYARAARLRGITADPVVVQQRFQDAFRAHVAAGNVQSGDGRAFWSPIVKDAVEADDDVLVEQLWAHYLEPRAWWVDIQALQVLGEIARSGVKLGIISNWDTRLRGLYARFALDRMFPVLICSAEVELEKPDPAIFSAACLAAGVRPSEAIHVGNDPVNDVDGANRAGLVGLLYDEEAGWAELPATVRRHQRFR